MIQQDGVTAVQHTSDDTLWILAVHDHHLTKMVGVTIVNGVDTGLRAARYMSERVDLTAASVSSAWDTAETYGFIMAYSCGDGYCVHSVSVVQTGPAPGPAPGLTAPGPAPSPTPGPTATGPAPGPAP